jgi:hypothetical protein
LSEGDGVYVMGFPLGLVGEHRDYVIARQGAIARVRDCLDLSSKDFLIDCAIFPGSSGSPVIVRPDMTSIRGTQPMKCADLIGIVSGYLPYQEIAISQQTGRPRMSFEENSGLGKVYPIDYAMELIEKAVAKALDAPPATEQQPEGAQPPSNPAAS